MSQEFFYVMDVRIEITGTEAKKDIVRDAIIAKLLEALAAGNIQKANWSINQNLVPEGGEIK